MRADSLSAHISPLGEDWATLNELPVSHWKMALPKGFEPLLPR